MTEKETVNFKSRGSLLFASAWLGGTRNELRIASAGEGIFAYVKDAGGSRVSQPSDRLPWVRQQ